MKKSKAEIRNQEFKMNWNKPEVFVLKFRKTSSGYTTDNAEDAFNKSGSTIQGGS
jgi:hypothetical protein